MAKIKFMPIQNPIDKLYTDVTGMPFPVSAAVTGGEPVPPVTQNYGIVEYNENGWGYDPMQGELIYQYRMTADFDMTPEEWSEFERIREQGLWDNWINMNLYLTNLDIPSDEEATAYLPSLYIEMDEENTIIENGHVHYVGYSTAYDCTTCPSFASGTEDMIAEWQIAYEESEEYKTISDRFIWNYSGQICDCTDFPSFGDMVITQVGPEEFTVSVQASKDLTGYASEIGESAFDIYSAFSCYMKQDENDPTKLVLDTSQPEGTNYFDPEIMADHGWQGIVVMSLSIHTECGGGQYALRWTCTPLNA